MTADRRRGSPLTLRLTAAFVLVAISAVVAFSALTLWRTEHTVGRLADERQQATAESIAETLALAYRQDGGWSGVDIHPATMIALQAGATVAVRDAAGRVVEPHNSMPAMGAMPDTSHGSGTVVTADVVVDDVRVGTVEVSFASSELATAERHVRDALSGTVLLGALSAATVAVLVAVPLSRRIIRPLQTVTRTAQLVGQGEPTARVGHHDAAGELGELARAFDDMADRLEANETARRHVVTDLAHELRTPLTILRAGCEEIIDGIAEPTLERFVEMHDDLLRLGRLVDDLNTLADADAARSGVGLRSAPCDLARIADSVVDDLRATIDAHGHDVTLDLEPAPIVGDESRLRQVIANLLSNAIKYTPSGGRLGVSTAIDPADGTAVLRVSDDGPGIDAADRPFVFQRFYRAASSAPIAGTGIGLAVVDQLVRAHGGSAAVLDTAAGTTIEVRLPGRPAADRGPLRARTDTSFAAGT